LGRKPARQRFDLLLYTARVTGEETAESEDLPVEASVLVIDDDPTARSADPTTGAELFRAVLADSRLAVDKVIEARPDVVVLDVMMLI